MVHHRSLWTRAALFSLVLALLAAPAMSQSFYGSLVSVVKDDQGGVIPIGASISCEPLATNNQATATLMKRFYQGLLANGESPAAALRAAQIAMWRGTRWRSPYYWAAFVAQGEWK